MIYIYIYMELQKNNEQKFEFFLFVKCKNRTTPTTYKRISYYEIFPSMEVERKLFIPDDWIKG